MRATNFSEQDGRLWDHTRAHSVNLGGAVPHDGEKSNGNAGRMALQYAARPLRQPPRPVLQHLGMVVTYIIQVDPVQW